MTFRAGRLRTRIPLSSARFAARASGTRAREAIQTLATAVGVGNDEAIKSANASLTAVRNQLRVANEQANVRQQVVNLQPAETAIESLTKETPEANKPLLDALLAAKKTAIDASATF